MIDRLSPRDKKFLMAAAAALTAYLAIIYVIQPIHRSQGVLEGKIENKIEFIKKYYEILNQKAYYEQQNQTNEKIQATLNQRFLDGDKPGLAAADLQKIIVDIAKQSSVKIDRVRIEKPKLQSGVLSVPVEISVRSSLKDLSQMIHLIENNQKFLVIEELVLRTTRSKGLESLKTRFLVTGFIKELVSKETKKI